MFLKVLIVGAVSFVLSLPAWRTKWLWRMMALFQDKWPVHTKVYGREATRSECGQRKTHLCMYFLFGNTYWFSNPGRLLNGADWKASVVNRLTNLLPWFSHNILELSITQIFLNDHVATKSHDCFDSMILQLKAQAVIACIATIAQAVFVMIIYDFLFLCYVIASLINATPLRTYFACQSENHAKSASFELPKLLKLWLNQSSHRSYAKNLRLSWKSVWFSYSFVVHREGEGGVEPMTTLPGRLKSSDRNHLINPLL